MKRRSVFLFLALSLLLLFWGEGRTGLANEAARGPRRIVSLNYCADELLLQLVEPGRIAALTWLAGDTLGEAMRERAVALPRIRGGIEEVMVSDPDLVLAGPFSPRGTLRFLQARRIPLAMMGIPRDFEDIENEIRKLAQRLGAEDRGEIMIASMKEALKNFPGSEELPRKRAVFFQGQNYVPGADTFENAIMEAAGLENLAASRGIRGYGSLSLEALIQMKPDVLILASDQEKSRTVRAEVLHHPAIRKALPDLKTVVLPAPLLHCGSPASVEAVCILAQAVSS
ncbi:MAG: ABC transporter substrate-binding protein [Candidatus Omnitrophota bacterium]